MSPDPAGMLQAIQDRAWYAVAAYAVVLLIALGRRLRPSLWSKIPQKLKWLPAVALTGGTAFVGCYVEGVSWDQAVSVSLFAMVMGHFTSVGIVKQAEGLKRKAVDVDTKGIGLNSIVLLKMGLLVCLVPILVACGKPEPCSPDGIVAGKRAAGAGAIVAGACDSEPLTDCPALGTAQRLHEAHAKACQGAAE